MSQSFSNCVIGSEVPEVARMPHQPPGGLELCQSRQAPGPFLSAPTSPTRDPNRVCRTSDGEGRRAIVRLDSESLPCGRKD